MRRGIIVAVLAAALVVIAGVVPEQGERRLGEVAEAYHRAGGKELRNGCHRLYPVRRVHGYMRARYHRRDAPLTRGQKRYVRRMTGCMFSARKARRARVLRKRLRAGLRARLAYYRLAPYGPCYGGRWAVPCEIIGGESGGSWTVANDGGCIGPYQFCGWSVPWPVRSWADRLAHHRMAARLWRGGAGCSNWTQTSSAC